LSYRFEDGFSQGYYHGFVYDHGFDDDEPVGSQSRQTLEEQPTKRDDLYRSSCIRLLTKVGYGIERNLFRMVGNLYQLIDYLYGIAGRVFGLQLILLLHAIFSPLSCAQIEPVAFIEPVIAPMMTDAATIPMIEAESDSSEQASQQPTPLSARTYSSDEIARLAALNASLAILMRGDLHADRAGVFRPSKRQQSTLDLRSKVQEYRIARQTQIAASQAMELHFGLATILALKPIQLEIQALVATRVEQQQRAIQSGISILDPHALDRLSASTRDTQLQSHGKSTEFRSQLALLIDPSIACHYIPEPMSLPQQADVDKCRMIEWAMLQRCDLVGLIYLREHLDLDTLDVARWMSDVLSGSASLATGLASKPLAILGIVSSKEKQARQAELCERLQMLDEAIKNLRAKIASEVEIALSRQQTTYDRYTNSQQQLELWRLRVAQLRSYGDEVKPQLADELEAELQVIHVQSELVQRQGEWHQAVVELALAVGCIP
jgi:hypothetical protein